MSISSDSTSTGSEEEEYVPDELNDSDGDEIDDEVPPQVRYV
jgi:hypothetical protein